MKKAYLAMKFRGFNGDNATEEEIAVNIQAAKEVGRYIQRHFPDHLEVYIPHIDSALNKDITRIDGVIQGSGDVLEMCCEIVSDMDLLIVVGAPTDGMLAEIQEANSAEIPVVIIEEWNEGAIGKIAQEIWEI